MAIIPARGNSKGIPRKNLAPLGGKPLISWTIAAALGAPSIERVIVSTEDPEIAAISRTAGVEVPFMRPAELAADAIHSVKVVLHTLTWLAEHDHYEPEVIVMLLPTAPFRTSEHIAAAVQEHGKHGDPVIGVARLELYSHRLRTIRDQQLKPIIQVDPDNQRQDAKQLYYVNGCIHIASYHDLITKQTFHTAAARPYLMDSDSSLDIDTPDDFIRAEKQLRVDAPAA